MPAPPDGGYLIIGDDTLFSHCQLAAFNASKVWFQRAVTGKRENLAAWLDVVEVTPFPRGSRVKMIVFLGGTTP